ncbi:MAG: glycosyltransferase family 39 protein [Ardenticatenaceae bacterium]|nr:glycosyltransferase family 39 protein [Ardenticatenaceae bacterium]
MIRITRLHALAFMVVCLLVTAVLRLPDLAAIPPGVHYDEAANGILAAEIGRGESRPLFIESYTGKEVLFFYLAGAMERLVGGTVFALRLTAVFSGILTVAATYWLGRELLPAGRRDRRVALLAAALLAVSFWHILFSRLGFRAITQPLLQALTVAALWRGLRRGQWRWLIFSGVGLGLTAYTYLAARLFPVVLLLAALPLLFNRQTYRLRWRQLTAVAAVGLVVLSPLLYYFATHPAAFWVRIEQVGPASSQTVLGSYWRTLQMFFLRGDPYVRFNVPERPLFSFLWGTLLVVGWVVCLLGWRKLKLDWQRATAVLLLSVPFIMILPTALAVNEITPSNLRAIGLIPFIFYLPALGFVVLVDDLAQRLARPSLAQAGFLVLWGVVLFAEGFLVWRLYFDVWGTDPAVFAATDGDLTAVAEFLNTLPPNPDETLYVAAPHYQHPTIAFLSDRYEDVKWLPDSAAFVLPPEGSALYVYPLNSPLPEWAEPFLEGAESLSAVNGPDGRPAFAAYRLTAVPTVTPPISQTVTFGNAVTLLGYDVGTAAAGESVPLTLYWRIDDKPAADFAPFVHLEDTWGARWSQAQTFAYPVAQWRPGEVVVQRVNVPAPPGTPPGDYRARLGWFNEASGERLPVLDGDGRFAGDSLVIEPLPITAGTPPDRLPQPPFPVDEEVRPGLHLLGYERGGNAAETGETLDLSFWWLADAPQTRLDLRVEAFRSDNTGRILLETEPVHGTYPFVSWVTPQFVIDRQQLRLPDNLESGMYRLQLHLFGAGNQEVGKVDLGPLAVTQTERLFTPPEVPMPLEVMFGGEISLLGYDLTPGDTDGTFELRLVWQAFAPPSGDYTVFIHVLNPDGTCCVWQQDAMPQQGQYPTSRWVAGEVVVDTYQIVLPDDVPGSYPVEVGLYVPENGRRLQVQSPLLPPSDVVYLNPLVVQE